ncbi:hypothetical protein Psyc_0033 [Psychrobacter arcticus 273-4]|uniref:Copper homeostasis protein n=1 Tax=Psychrobacter arcticus (strain DSM 17307 / VKM B-2377 / 273-4) TaxID=259536 RepID=Q4FVQ1_PSYA2|nr:copper resistance protein NlpE N-terminal domain-containing protein [Psychrobacter arcticus]AAZ17907.1 hypothetical protein Psyc_0033 [Psychrobacter arcticus 273-4]
MINFSPVFSTSLIIKRCTSLLLAVPVCIALVSCDSASSSTNKNTQGAPINSDQSKVLNNDEAVLEENSAKASVNEDGRQEGQALIAAASSNDSSARSPMISASNSDSILQATLMGDYGGVVPCPSCGSINITLNLFADGSVLKTSVFNQAETPQPPLIESGVYRQDNDVITIVYEKKNIETYQIQNNHLIMMDEYKNPDEDYALARQ